MPKRVRGQTHQLGLVSLPVTRAVINGFVVSDCLLDSGSQKSIIDRRVLDMIAPQAELGPATALISASGHPLKALGTCSLPVKIDTNDAVEEVCFLFTVVDGLSHDCILGWDFLQSNRVILDCSDVTGQVKVRLKKPVRVPPRSVLCLCIRTDQELSADSEYVLTGQRSGRVEIMDALIKPYSSREIPLVVRNRSDRFVSLHRRDVVGYLQPADGANVTDAVPRSTHCTDTDTPVTNAVSSSDAQFLGMDTEEILSQFSVGEQVSGASRDKLASLLRSFSGVFSASYADVGCYNKGEIDLQLAPGAKPQFSKPYPIPWAKEQALRDQLTELESSGIIAVGESSDWNSPVILVPKGKSTEFRIVQDMRDINKSLLPKKFILPNIDDFLYSLQGWNIASSLDIKHAFWNLRLSEESQKICAFYALGTTFYPKRMPMGCSQSSYFLHLVMHRVLGDIPGVSIYADDVLLTSKDTDSHLKLLHTVLSRLNEAGFKLSPNKCMIGMRKLSYLGHQITPEGISLEPERIRCIEELRPPTSIKEAKRLYGFYAWFRKFIPSFSTVSAPLVRLSNAEVFYWDAELDDAFHSLRESLLSNRVLAYPTRDGSRFVLYTDSSTVGSGQILCQIKDGEEKVIAFNGSKYSKAQTKWTIFELELFSFITGLKKFYKYLDGAEFTWVCDCKSALKILQNKDVVNPRVIRWRSYVSQFHFETEHRPGTAMQHVDMLSRIPETQSGAGQGGALPGAGEQDEVASGAGQGGAPPAAGRAGGTESGEEPGGQAEAAGPAAAEDGGSIAEHRGSGAGAASGRVNVVAGPSPDTLSMDRDTIIWYQKHDKDCRAVVHYLKYKKWPKFCSPTLKREDVDKFELRDGILCIQGGPGTAVRIVWPRAKRFELLYQHHDPSHHGHCGHEKLFEKVSRHVWYLGLKHDCKNYVDSCERCSQKKDSRGAPAPPLLPQPPGGPGDVLVIDIVHMPSSRVTGRSLVLTCVDKFTGFLTHYPLAAGTADNIVNALLEQFLRYGPPQHIETDAGANLKSQKVSELCKFWGITMRHSVGYHHEAVGKIERRHLDIKRRLRALTDSYGVDWEEHLLSIVFSLNNEVSSAHGYSPHFLFFMRHVNSPVSRLISQSVPRYSDDFVHEKLRLVASTLKTAHETVRVTQASQKRAYDLRHRAREPAIRPGDQVRLRNVEPTHGVSRKLVPPWSPVHIVVRWLSRRHVECLNPQTGQSRRVHVKYLKRVVDRFVD